VFLHAILRCLITLTFYVFFSHNIYAADGQVLYLFRIFVLDSGLFYCRRLSQLSERKMVRRRLLITDRRLITVAK